jgi:hypothetical protein
LSSLHRAAGSGTLTFQGRTYRLSVGGPATASPSAARRPARPGQQHRARVGHRGRLWRGLRRRHGDPRPQAIVLTNQKGAILELAGTQTGLILNLDLSGMALTLR